MQKSLHCALNASAKMGANKWGLQQNFITTPQLTLDLHLSVVQHTAQTSSSERNSEAHALMGSGLV